MDWIVWVTLGLGLTGLSGTIIVSAIRLTWWLGDKLDDITTKQQIALNSHERRDEERHAENIGRFTALETAILKNGHSKRRR